MQRECGRLIRQGVPRKGWHLSLKRNMLDDGFRVFQDVSTLEDVFRFPLPQTEQSGNIRPWWEMCTLDPRNGISLAEKPLVLLCWAVRHMWTTGSWIFKEKRIWWRWAGWVEVCWSYSFVSLMFSFLFDATWTLYRRVCAESWMMLSANRKLSRLFSLCFPFTWCSSFLHSTRKGAVPAAFEQSRRSMQRHCKTSWDNEKPRRLVLQLMKRMQCISWISWLARQRCRTAWEGLCKSLFDVNGTSRWSCFLSFGHRQEASAEQRRIACRACNKVNFADTVMIVFLHVLPSYMCNLG